VASTLPSIGVPGAVEAAGVALRQAQCGEQHALVEVLLEPADGGLQLVEDVLDIHVWLLQHVCE
jgi:hypothetical protein